MSGSMVDIRFATAENRRRKKEAEETTRVIYKLNSLPLSRGRL